jgi:hypothetical protein
MPKKFWPPGNYWLLKVSILKVNIGKEEDVNIKSCWAILILVHTGSV